MTIFNCGFCIKVVLTFLLALHKHFLKSVQIKQFPRYIKTTKYWTLFSLERCKGYRCDRPLIIFYFHISCCLNMHEKRKNIIKVLFTFFLHESNFLQRFAAILHPAQEVSRAPCFTHGSYKGTSEQLLTY